MDDESYHKDMDALEHQLSVKQALTANLNDRVEALQKVSSSAP